MPISRSWSCSDIRRRVMCIAVMALAALVTGGPVMAADVGDPPAAASPASPPVDAPPAPTPIPPAPSPPASPTRTDLLPGLPNVPNVPSANGLSRALAAWRAHIDGGTRDLEAGRWLPAQEHFRAALILDPSDGECLSRYATALEGAKAERRAAIVRRQAVEMAHDNATRAERWVEVARNAEARALSTEALDAWRRARSLRPDPAVDARIADLRKIEPMAMMSPRSLCPGLLDAWGCAPSVRPSEGDLRCSCEVERLDRTRMALAGGVRETDAFGIPTLDDRVLLAAALIRIRGAGIALLDTHYLAVETGSGGWQLVDRVVDGWQPGAAYTAREGALIEMGFRDLGDAAIHGPSLVLRAVNRSVDGDFERRTVRRARAEMIHVCHADGGLRCVSAPIAMRAEVRAMTPDAKAAPEDVDWAVDVRFEADGTLVATERRGHLPGAMQALVGTHPLTGLGQLPEAVVTPLR